MKPIEVLEALDDYLDAFRGIKNIAVVDSTGNTLPITHLTADLENNRILVHLEQD